MLLRSLSNLAGDWNRTINENLKSSLSELDELMQQLVERSGSDVQSFVLDTTLWNRIWLCLGSLATYGGIFF